MRLVKMILQYTLLLRDCIYMFYILFVTGIATLKEIFSYFERKMNVETYEIGILNPPMVKYLKYFIPNRKSDRT